MFPFGDKKTRPSTSGASTSTAQKLSPEMKKIHDDCYVELMDTVRSLANSVGVSAAAVMNIQVCIAQKHYTVCVCQKTMKTKKIENT